MGRCAEEKSSGRGIALPERRNTGLPEPREEPLWAVLRRAALGIIAVGVLLLAVGVLTGQSVGLLAIDLLGAVLGAIMLLVVRWH